jgi:hypothetical protein
MQVAIFVILGLLSAGSLVAALSAALTNTDFGFACFKYLILVSLIASVATLINVIAQIGLGNLTSSLEWTAAAVSSLVALGCLYFINFRIKQ